MLPFGRIRLARIDSHPKETPSMNWFEKLTGFDEQSPEQVRSQMEIVDSIQLRSRINGRVMRCGRFETPTLGELRQRAAQGSEYLQRTTFSEVVGDVRHFHLDPSHARVLFQVASQFNTLEMADPSVTPEEGVGIYEYDHTQGPTCAIACGAGTIFRNYFVPIRGRFGQTADQQIDCLADVGAFLGNHNSSLWSMRNGYMTPSHHGLQLLNQRLEAMSETQLDHVRSLLRIGLQWDTEVTLAPEAHVVSQAYCSGLPLNYVSHSHDQWEPLARLILEAAYDATLCAAVVNHRAGGSSQVYLTLLGGGVFGNPTSWIVDALLWALKRHANAGLGVEIVSYRSSKPEVQTAVNFWQYTQ